MGPTVQINVEFLQINRVVQLKSEKAQLKLVKLQLKFENRN